MAKGYWIAHVTVNDPSKYPDYVAANAVAFEKYGGRFLVRGGDNEIKEGQMRDRHVVIEFSSYAKALECYASPEYQRALDMRREFADADVIVIEGYDP